MKSGSRIPPRHVPTLTEVVTQQPDEAISSQAADLPVPATEPVTTQQAELIRRVLVGLHRRLDAELEPRLRAALEPVIAEVAAALLRETRTQVAETLRELVTQAVAQELARRRRR